MFARQAMEQRRARGEGLTGARLRAKAATEKAAGKTPAAVEAAAPRAAGKGAGAGGLPRAPGVAGRGPGGDIAAGKGRAPRAPGVAGRGPGGDIAAGKGRGAQPAAPAPAPEGLAEGGPALAGRDYIVGEEGPEWLRMGGQSGQVIPSRDMSSWRSELEKPIEPVIRPRMQNMGPASMRWQRHAERQRDVDNTRRAARETHVDLGFA